MTQWPSRVQPRCAKRTMIERRTARDSLNEIPPLASWLFHSQNSNLLFMTQHLSTRGYSKGNILPTLHSSAVFVKRISRAKTFNISEESVWDNSNVLKNLLYCTVRIVIFIEVANMARFSAKNKGRKIGEKKNERRCVAQMSLSGKARSRILYFQEFNREGLSSSNPSLHLD